MKWYEQICVRDFTHAWQDNQGGKLTLKRGQTYTTGYPVNGMVHVFTSHWAWVPQSVFDGVALTVKR